MAFNAIVSTELRGELVHVGDMMVVPMPYGAPRVRFRYDDDFVAEGYAIDPSLRLDGAPHEINGLPLAAEDACPDAWGQALLQRAERMAAEAEGRPSERLGPERFLLQASDLTRQGALRFQTEQDGEFLAANATVPKMVDMSALLADAEEIAADPNTDNWEAVKRLLETGTSALGGARPKAAVLDEEAALWLAKFPRVGDGNDVPVWEMVALDFAERAGLVVPPRRLETVARRHVLMVRRFDRTPDGRRIPYISARTLLGTRDLGATGDYRSIAQRLRRQSPDPKRDMELLWRQAALNLFVNNTDNHLRNLGFLRRGVGWELSPVFDLDPNPDTGTMFATHLGGAAQRTTGLRNLLPMAVEIGIAEQRARTMLDEMIQAVEGWDDDARRYGASDAEVRLFRDAFTGLLPAAKAILVAK